MFVRSASNLSLDETTRESARRVMTSLIRGTYQEHVLSNGSVPFTVKQSDYLAGYCRMLKSLNYRHIMTCEGEQ